MSDCPTYTWEDHDGPLPSVLTRTSNEACPECGEPSYAVLSLPAPEDISVCTLPGHPYNWELFVWSQREFSRADHKRFDAPVYFWAVLHGGQVIDLDCAGPYGSWAEGFCPKYAAQLAYEAELD